LEGRVRLFGAGDVLGGRLGQRGRGADGEEVAYVEHARDLVGDVLDGALGHAVGHAAEQQHRAVEDRDLDLGGVDIGVDGEGDVEVVADRFIGAAIAARAAAPVRGRQLRLELDAGVVEGGVFAVVDAAAVEAGVGAVALI